MLAFRHAPRLLALLLLGALTVRLWEPGVHAQGPNAMSLTRAQIIAGLARSRQALAKLPSLYVSYRLETERVTPPGFAWPWVELVHAIKPPKMYLYKEDPVMWGQEKQVPKGFTWVQEAGYDGAVSLEMKWEKPGPRSARVHGHGSVVAEPHETMSVFAYYFRYLGHAISNKMEHGFPARKRYPTGSYWLPDALVEHENDYELLPQRRKIDGHLCYVLERPGLDKLWVDPAQGFAVLRRDFHWTNGGPLRHVIYNRDHKQIAPDVWLPRAQVIEHYFGPWEARERWNHRYYRQTITVHKLSTEGLPDSQFVGIDVPPGTELADYRTDSYFKIPPTGADPFEEAMAHASTGIFGKSSFLFWLIVLGGLLGSGLLTWLLLRRFRRELGGKRG